MDTKTIDKINGLTDGIHAKEYFLEHGLTYLDAKSIKEELTKRYDSNEIQFDDVENELNDIINDLMISKGLVAAGDETSGYTPDEKLLIFDLNNRTHEFSCENCKAKVLISFNYCPSCGKELESKQLIIISTVDVNLEKGYVTTEELSHLRLITPDEQKRLAENNVNKEEIGIPLTPENCPFEIRDETIHEDIKEDKEARRQVYEKNVKLHSKGIDNIQLTAFNDKSNTTNKKYPLDKTKIPQISTIKTGRTTNSMDTHKKTTRTTEATPEKVDTIKDKKDEEDLNLEYVGVLYLFDVIKHPQKPKLPDNLLYWLDVSSNRKITNYLKKNNYMDVATDYDLIRANLQALKVSDLKEILSQNNLKVSGRKAELIDRICEEVPRQKLDKYTKINAFTVTDEGKTFINNHPHVELYAKYLKRFELELYEKAYQENKNLSPEELVLKYLNIIRDYYAEKLDWYKFNLTYEEERKVYHNNKDHDNELKAAIDEFICSVNPWTTNAIDLNYSNLISDNLRKAIIKLMNKHDITSEELSIIFKNEAEKIKLPGLFMTSDDMLNYFIRLYEDNDELNEEISKRFDRSSLNYGDMQFKNKEEQGEIFEMAKKFFN